MTQVKPHDRVAPTFDFVVEPGKAAEFARATASRLIGGFAPVTFPASSALWMEPEHSAWFGIERDFRWVLHGEQRFDYPRGLPPLGTAFTARQRFGRRYEKSGRQGLMRFTEVITDFWIESEDNPEVTMTSVSISLPAPEDRPTEPALPGTPPRSEGSSTPDPALPLSQLVTEPLTVTDFVKYQGASGDFNPIHHDTDFAVRGGHPGPFAVGMLVAGVAAGQVIEVGDPAGLRMFKTRWKGQAWPGDRLSYVVLPARDVDRPGGIDVIVRRDGGDVHMQAWADFA